MAVVRIKHTVMSQWRMCETRAGPGASGSYQDTDTFVPGRHLATSNGPEPLPDSNHTFGSQFPEPLLNISDLINHHVFLK